MPPLAAIERFFERLFERPTARLFRTRVQPVQVQRRIERAMEAGRRPGGDRMVVPNRYTVHLHPNDLAALAESADGLASGLADEALSFARAHRYVLLDRPSVDVIGDPTVQPADIRVVAREVAPDAVVAAPGPQPGLEAPIHSDPTATAVFSLPQTKAPRARLAVTDPDGRQRSIPIEGDLTIGRAEDNNLVARDGSVSRHHGRIVARRGTLVYVDLGSTNGSRVNGESVSEVVLGVGDQIEIGETTLLLEVAEDAP
jgi:hypothetical protein